MSLSDDSQQLRQLARAVMAGELTRDEYHRQRRVVIDRYAGDTPVTALPLSSVVEFSPLPGIEHTQPNGVAAPIQPYRHPSHDSTPPPAAPLPVAGDGHVSARDLMIGVLAVTVVLLVLGGALALIW